MSVILGNEYKAHITGFEGVATGFVQYITGCNQALLAPSVGSDGTLRDSNWFDIQRLEPIDSKTIRLDNGPTPGPDKPAPKR